MQFELNNIDVDTDRDFVIGTLRLTAQQQFMQRRANFPSPTKNPMLARYGETTVVNVLSKMTGLPLQLIPKKQPALVSRKDSLQPTREMVEAVMGVLGDNVG